MKDLEIERKHKENEQKVFTKSRIIDIINKDYNPLKVNYKNKIIYERDECYNMEYLMLKEFKRDFSFRERLFIHMFSKTFIKVYKKGIEKGFNSHI